jgi:hypothetical protein
MKHFFLFSLLMPLLSFAQPGQINSKVDTVISRYKEGAINEKFVRNSEGRKDGPYVRYTRFGNKYITGQYKDGAPVGTWSYYSSDSSGVLVQTLNFDTKQETFVDSLRVHSLICGPRYFGGNMLEYEYIQSRMRTDFTEAERQLYKGKTFTVTFTIDSISLKPVTIACTDQTLPESFRKKMEAIVADMPAWLPPVCNNKTEVWRFSVPFPF